MLEPAGTAALGGFHVRLYSQGEKGGDGDGLSIQTVPDATNKTKT